MADLTIGARLFVHNDSQDLSLAALDTTTSFSTETRLSSVMIHSSASISQDITITVDNISGSNYDTVIQSDRISSGTDYIYQPTSRLYLQDGSEIRVQVTNSGTPSATVYVTVTSIQE